MPGPGTLLGTYALHGQRKISRSGSKLLCCLTVAHGLDVQFATVTGEDEMEAFLSKHGGSSNAFTDCAIAEMLV